MDKDESVRRLIVFACSQIEEIFENIKYSRDTFKEAVDAMNKMSLEKDEDIDHVMPQTMRDDIEEICRNVAILLYDMRGDAENRDYTNIYLDNEKLDKIFEKVNLKAQQKTKEQLDVQKNEVEKKSHGR